MVDSILVNIFRLRKRFSLKQAKNLMSVNYNGKHVSGQMPLSLNDRALQYGDGIFETILGVDGQLQHLQRHWQRLLKACSALHLILPDSLTEQYLIESFQRLSEENGLIGKVRFKLMVWRKDGGLFTPITHKSNFLMKAETYNVARVVKENAGWAEKVKLYEHPFSSFKTLNCLPYVMAGIEREARKLDELILLDVNGAIAECSSSNIFWSTNKEFYTPALDTGCIEGVMRSVIIEKIQAKKQKIHIGRFLPEELLKANYVFCSNVTGIYHILKLGESHFSVPDLTWLK